MFYLFGVTVGHCKVTQTFIFVSPPKFLLSLIEVKIDFIVEFYISHFLEVDPDEVEDVHFEDQLTAFGNQGNIILSAVSILRRYYYTPF